MYCKAYSVCRGKPYTNKGIKTKKGEMEMQVKRFLHCM